MAIQNVAHAFRQITLEDGIADNDRGGVTDHEGSVVFGRTRSRVIVELDRIEGEIFNPAQHHPVERGEVAGVSRLDGDLAGEFCERLPLIVQAQFAVIACREQDGFAARGVRKRGHQFGGGRDRNGILNCSAHNDPLGDMLSMRCRKIVFLANQTNVLKLSSS